MHLIRLRGPWELEPLVRFERAGAGWHAVADDLPRGGKTRVPGDWAHLLGADFCGRARYTRRFNRPTNLDAGELVWLVVAGVDHRATLELNDQSLGSMRGTEEPHRAEVTGLLAARNLLTVDVELPGEVYGDPQARGDRAGRPGGLVGEVRLEIGRQ